MPDLCEIQFMYNFVSHNDSITNKDQRNVAEILSVDATLTITIGGELYFETELAILEFYKALWQWKQSVKGEDMQLSIITRWNMGIMRTVRFCRSSHQFGRSSRCITYLI